MLLTDGSIHLFIQSVAEQYNAFLPNLYHYDSSSLCSTLYKPLTSGHVKYSCFTGADFLACLFICLFLLYPISTIKPFTTLLQFTFLKYLFKGIIVCRGQLLCSIIYHLLLTRWKLLLECASMPT